jgi:3-keto-5-aminohexanoate cleavage enzyme
MGKKIAITCAVTGAETSRVQNPALPVTPDEIGDAAFDAWTAGASILHLHVRDEGGKPTQDIAVFKETMERVRELCDIVIEVTTGGAVGMSIEERMQPLRLNPEMASLDCGTVNFGDEHIVNTLPTIRAFASEMRARRIRPTLECFDLSHIDTSKLLIEEELVSRPFHYGLVLNVPGGLRYDRETVELLVRRLPQDAFWTLIGIGGKVGLKKLGDAMTLGGFVRVGMEDNVYYDKGRLAKSNAELVERAARMARQKGLEVATPGDVRALLGIRKR